MTPVRVGGTRAAASRTLAVSIALGGLWALGACQPDVGGGGNMAGSGGPTGSGGSGNPGTGGGAGPGSGGAPPGFTLECAKPNPGSPSLRLFTRGELEATLGDIFPEVKGQWSSGLPANQLSDFGFDNDASVSVGKQLSGALIDTALSVATAVTGAPLANLLPCSSTTADRACAEQFLTKYGKRLFRRTVTPAEHDRYLAFFDASKTKSDFKTALKWMAVGLIQSPNAIYRSEIGAASSDGTRQLTPFEVASSLSYTYTGTTPTADLLAKAEAGNMGDLLALAEGMLATEQGKLMVQRFFEGYLDYTSVSSVQRPGVPNFNSVAPQMAQETRAFINDVVLAKGGGLKQLLTATTTNPSQGLAAYYGFPAPAGDYAAVTRPAGRGIGILAQGAFLTTHASPDSSSPTRRGLFPYLHLLCEKKLSPPPNVPQISAPQPGQKTTRQRYEDVHVKMGGACAACHQRFDPIGFGFEHFDEGGRYRETEGGLAIDASGKVTKGDGTVLFTFNGQEELVTSLANQPVIHQCMAAYLATFAFGSSEACLGASKVADLQAGTIGIAEAFAQLAAEPHFTKRNAQ
ncbi:MAG: DUF1588 domain-containing protein [Pseudomonadota bacterium]